MVSLRQICYFTRRFILKDSWNEHLPYYNSIVRQKLAQIFSWPNKTTHEPRSIDRTQYIANMKEMSNTTTGETSTNANTIVIWEKKNYRKESHFRILFMLILKKKKTLLFMVCEIWRICEILNVVEFSISI